MRRSLPWLAGAIALLALVAWFVGGLERERGRAERAAVARDGVPEAAALRSTARNGDGRPTAPRALVATSELDVEGAADTDDGPRPASTPFPGSLAVRVVYASDGAPAVGAKVRMRVLVANDLASRVGHDDRSTFGRTGATPRPGQALGPWEVAGERLPSDTNEAGFVHVPRRSPFVVLTARNTRDGVEHGGEWAWPEVELPMKEAPDLVLHPVSALDVRVLDATGRPVADMPVAVIALGEGAPSILSGADTDDDGRARLFERSGRWSAEREKGAALVVRALGVFATPVEVPFAEGQDSVELVLPPSGSVLVDAAVSESAGVALATAGDLGPTALVVPARGERALFPHVGLDLALEALVVDLRRSEPDAFDGPRAPGERVEHRLRADVGARLFHATLVDERGAPLANQGVEVAGALGNARRNRSTRTNAEGRLRFVAEADWSMTFTALDLGADAVPARSRSATIAAEVLDAAPAPERDLGTVTLTPEPIVVAGRVVTADGRPVAGARVRALTAARVRVLMAGTSRAQGSYTATDADGAFCVTSAPATPLELHVTAAGLRVPAPLPFAPGTVGLEVVLAAEARLVVDVRFPPGVPPESLRVVVEHGDELIATATAPARRAPTDEASEPVRHEASGLTPGPARLGVRSASTGLEAVGVELLLVADETARPALLDLDGTLELIEVAVLDELDEHLRGVTLVMRDAAGATTVATGAQSPVRLPRPGPDAELEARAPDRLPARAPATGERIELRPELARELTLRLPAGFPTPRAAGDVLLLPQRGTGRGSSLPMIELGPSGSHRIRLGAPGRYRVLAYTKATLFLGGAGLSLDFEVTAADFEAERPIELAFDLDAWTALLAGVPAK